MKKYYFIEDDFTISAQILSDDSGWDTSEDLGTYVFTSYEDARKQVMKYIVDELSDLQMKLAYWTAHKQAPKTGLIPGVSTQLYDENGI